jgi:ApaG protein
MAIPMYEQETRNVLVRAEPSFLEAESDPDESRFVWAYTIEIENRGKEPVQLLSRRWAITDAQGVTQQVKGSGVIGQQPVIHPGEAFRYTSAAPLAQPSGIMVGAYEMFGLDAGESFEIAVPAFALESPFSATRLPN